MEDQVRQQNEAIVARYLEQPTRLPIELRRQVEDHFDFQIVLARTEIGGYCSHCQALRKSELEKAAAEAPVMKDTGKAKVRKSAE